MVLRAQHQGGRELMGMVAGCGLKADALERLRDLHSQFTKKKNLRYAARQSGVVGSLALPGSVSPDMLVPPLCPDGHCSGPRPTRRWHSMCQDRKRSQTESHSGGRHRGKNPHKMKVEEEERMGPRHVCVCVYFYLSSWTPLGRRAGFT